MPQELCAPTNNLWIEGNHYYSPIHLAAERHHFHTVKLLADNGADLNKPVDSWLGITLAHLIAGDLPLYSSRVAPDSDVLDCLKFLSEHGCKLTVGDIAGKTPVNVAYKAGRYELAAGITQLIAGQAEPKLSLAMPRRQAANQMPQPGG